MIPYHRTRGKYWVRKIMNLQKIKPKEREYFYKKKMPKFIIIWAHIGINDSEVNKICSMGLERYSAVGRAFSLHTIPSTSHVFWAPLRVVSEHRCRSKPWETSDVTPTIIPPQSPKERLLGTTMVFHLSVIPHPGLRLLNSSFQDDINTPLFFS